MKHREMAARLAHMIAECYPVLPPQEVEVIDAAIAALKKAETKMAVYDDEWQEYFCPVCDNPLPGIKTAGYCYCPECGQKIWSKEEKDD